MGLGACVQMFTVLTTFLWSIHCFVIENSSHNLAVFKGSLTSSVWKYGALYPPFMEQYQCNSEQMGQQIHVQQVRKNTTLTENRKLNSTNLLDWVVHCSVSPTRVFPSFHRWGSKQLHLSETAGRRQSIYIHKLFVASETWFFL